MLNTPNSFGAWYRMMLYCVLILLPSVTTAQTKNTITWMVDESDFIELYLSEKQVSIGIDTANLVLQQLPHYTIEFNASPVPRTNQQLKINDNVCTANRIKTIDREASNLFSLPMSLHPSARLYYRKDSVNIPEALIAQDGTLINLAALVTVNAKANFGIARGLSYGEMLDDVIANIPSDRVSFYNSEKRYKSGPKLLSDGLLDMTLLYSSQWLQLNDTPLPADSNIAYIPLKQVPYFIPTYIACSRSAFGHNVINDINEVLLSLYDNDTFKAAHKRYLPKQEYALFEAQLEKLKTLQKRDASPTLTVAFDHFPPYSLIGGDGEFIGLDRIFIDEIAAKANIKVDFYACPFARCLKLLERGDADLYVSLFKSHEREQYIEFIEPHHGIESSQTFYVLTDRNITIASYEDLAGKRIGTIRNSKYFEPFDSDTTLRKSPLVSADVMLDMLTDNRVDAIVGIKIAIDDIIKKRNLTGTIRHAKYAYPGSRKTYLGMSKKSRFTYLLPALSQAVADTPYPLR